MSAQAIEHVTDVWAEDTLAGQCDACSARALVLTEHRPTGSHDLTLQPTPEPRLTLQWCKHHFERYQTAMGTAGAVVLVDNRDELYP